MALCALCRKLRDRDEDMIQIQNELAEKRRTLDTLATELRDLQSFKLLQFLNTIQRRRK